MRFTTQKPPPPPAKFKVPPPPQPARPSTPDGYGPRPLIDREELSWVVSVIVGAVVGLVVGVLGGVVAGLAYVAFRFVTGVGP